MKDHAAKGVRSMVSVFSTDPGVIGAQLLLSVGIWLVYSACLTLIVRWQQTWPWTEPPLIGRLFFTDLGGQLTPEFFSWLVTARDSAAVFFVALPLMVGVVGNLVMPPGMGAQHYAWGRWNRASFWMLWLAFGSQVSAFFLAAWSSAGSPITQLASLVATSLAATAFLMMAIWQLVTVLQFRRRGLTFSRLPLAVWGLVITNSFLCVAIPIFLLSLTMQVTDAVGATSFLSLSEFVPRSIEQDAPRVTRAFHAAVEFRQTAVTYLLLLPGIGLVCDRLRGRGQTPQANDRLTRYAMLGIGGLALAAWLHTSPALGGKPWSASGPPVLPTRLVALPLALVIGSWVVAARAQRGQRNISWSFAVTFALALTTGAFMSVLLATQPLGSYLQATYAADAQWCCLMLFGSMLAIWVEVYDRMTQLPGRRLFHLVGWLHCLLTCVCLQAAWWIWFALGVAGLPAGVADPRPFDTPASAFTLQFCLTVLLAVLFGAQLLAAASLLVCRLRVRTAK